MARTVEDAALVLEVLAGRQYDISNKGTDLRIGICKKGGMGESKDSEWLKANEELIVLMKGRFNCIEMPDHNIDDSFVFPIMQYEFKYAMNSYLAAYRKNPQVPKDLKEIIEYNEKHADLTLKYGQGNLLAANKVSDNWKNEPEHLKAITDRNNAISDLDKYFDENKIDVLFMCTAHYGLAPATGFPSITIPIGKTKAGLPIGCCFIARRLHEEVLLKVTKTLETALN